MPFYHCSSTQLEAGSIIRPGNWGRIIRNTGWGHNQALKEAALEYVRQSEFPDKPSRMMSSFFFDDENEAHFYSISDNRQITMIVYQVAIDLLVQPHVGDWRGTQPRGSVSMDRAREYWLGQFQPPHQTGASCRELIVVTSLQIIRRV